MLCQFERLIYPRKGAASPNGFMIAIYKPCGTLKDASGRSVERFKAVGYCLPTSSAAKYRMAGRWTRSAAHGVQFEVECFEEVIAPTKEGIIAYLASGQIKGVGRGIAERIYKAFGDDTLTILDKEPDKLLSVPGISKKRLQRISDSYAETRGARDVVTFLAPYGVTPNLAVKIYQEYGKDALSIVKENPYRLCEMAGIAFLTADKLATNMGRNPISPERVDEALSYVLSDAESNGHMCLEKHTFIDNALKLMATPGITKDMAAGRAAQMVQNGRLFVYGDSVFLDHADSAEGELARALVNKCREKVVEYANLDVALQQEEQELNFHLAQEQKQAIKATMTYPLCVITGGPGTGKTSVQRAMLDMFRQRNPDARIVCCAPTGKAAQRMAQSTGLPASTIHKALMLVQSDEEKFGMGEIRKADLVLVDEVSMMDTYLANNLFREIRPGCRVVLVGDSDQLPSVGPGAVLKEIITSEEIPVVRLDQVFRQKTGSRIATNAKLIRHGVLSLEYGSDFVFYDSHDLSESAELIVSLYLQEVSRNGIENVAVLSPFRQRTETGVNTLNERLQMKVNPPNESKRQVLFRQRIFREGDRVMQTKNSDKINNGDTGIIVKIADVDEKTIVTVDFGGDLTREYGMDELDQLDLAYASTVHKSQGGEYKTVIISLQNAQFIMLKRSILYTAITRAKEKAIIVGDRKALCIAIRNTDTEQRGTKLSQRIRDLLQ